MARPNRLLSFHAESRDSISLERNDTSLLRSLMKLESMAEEVNELGDSVQDLIEKKDVIQQVVDQQEQEIQTLDTTEEIEPEVIENKIMVEQQVVEGQLGGLGIPTNREMTATEAFYQATNMQSKYQSLASFRTESYISSLSHDRVFKLKQLYKANHEGFVETVKELSGKILDGIKQLCTGLINYIKEFLGGEYAKFLIKLEKKLSEINKNPDGYFIEKPLQKYTTRDGVGCTLAIKNFDVLLKNIIECTKFNVGGGVNFHMEPLDVEGVEMRDNEYKNWLLPVDEGFLGADHAGFMRVEVIKPTKVNTGCSDLTSAIEIGSKLVNIIKEVGPSVRKRLEEDLKHLEIIIQTLKDVNSPLHPLQEKWYTALLTGIIQSVGTLYKTADFVFENIVKR